MKRWYLSRISTNLDCLLQSSPGEISDVLRQLVQKSNLTSEVASPVALIFGQEFVKNFRSRLSNEVHENGISVAQPLPNINARNEDENEVDKESVSQVSDNTQKKKNILLQLNRLHKKIELQNGLIQSLQEAINTLRKQFKENHNNNKNHNDNNHNNNNQII